MAADRAVGSCSGGSGPGGDVYRYAIATGALRCVTCHGGQEADVALPGWKRLCSRPQPAGALAQIGVAAQGSAVYFHSAQRLVPGAAPEGVYRVAVGGPEDGRLDYVAPAQQTVRPARTERRRRGGLELGGLRRRAGARLPLRRPAP